MNAIMEEGVGIFRVKDKARSDGFPELTFELLDRVLVDHRQRREVRAVAQAAKQL